MTVIEAPRFATRTCGHRVPVGRVKCPYCLPPRLSIEPLAEAIACHCRSTGGVHQTSVEVATRLGMSVGRVERQIRRILTGDMKQISFRTADSFSIALNRMPAELWGREWDDASPAEPYGDEGTDW